MTGAAVSGNGQPSRVSKRDTRRVMQASLASLHVIDQRVLVLDERLRRFETLGFWGRVWWLMTGATHGT